MSNYDPRTYISNISLHLSQDGNTMGTTSDYEDIIINKEYQLTGEEGFFVIKTEGWSMDSEKDLEKICKKINKFVKDWEK